VVFKRDAVSNLKQRIIMMFFVHYDNGAANITKDMKSLVAKHMRIKPRKIGFTICEFKDKGNRKKP
jgi:hypothetical protein